MFPLFLTQAKALFETELITKNTLQKLGQSRFHITDVEEKQ